MNQENHWPLGSRFMSAEEVSAQRAKSARSVDAFLMTLSDASASVAAGALPSSELLKDKQASSSREIRPVNWLGRP